MILGDRNAHSSIGYGGQKIWVILTDEIGNELLNETLGENDNYTPNSIVEISEEEFVIGGTLKYEETEIFPSFLMHIKIETTPPRTDRPDSSSPNLI